jgi:hypothetical protein
VDNYVSVEPSGHPSKECRTDVLGLRTSSTTYTTSFPTDVALYQWTRCGGAAFTGFGCYFCPSWDPLRVQSLVTTTTSAGRRDASVRLPRTPRGTVGTQPRGGLGAFWGASGPSNAMTCHSPTEAAPARDVCAVTDCWDALAWLGEMTLAARNVCWAIDGRWPRITRRIDGLKWSLGRCQDQG